MILTVRGMGEPLCATYARSYLVHKILQVMPHAGGQLRAKGEPGDTQMRRLAPQISQRLVGDVLEAVKVQHRER